MNKKFALIIEFSYIALAIFCLVMGIYKNIQLGLNTLVWIWYGLTFACILMFFLRRMQRRNIEKRKNNKYK